jgi:hypothetical protein
VRGLNASVISIKPGSIGRAEVPRAIEFPDGSPMAMIFAGGDVPFRHVAFSY